ncbi:hypothetical protein BC830DRAFT_582563 [Chytriomyces sp. MP71]|nr:hypothetical protein BC830DRAFT_582563 [Chytriomyces sp. MP71]
MVGLVQGQLALAFLGLYGATVIQGVCAKSLKGPLLPSQDMNEAIAGFLRMFYVVDPYSTSFRSLEEVPNYVLKAQPIFIGFLLLEMGVILWLNLTGSQRAPKFPRLNDTIGSVGAGIVQQMSHLITGDFELAAYVWLYSNFALFHFEGKAELWVWLLAFLGVDFAYYWAHRGAHELNIGWASHVTHHNSQDYNLSTALRQSFTQGFFTWVFNMPMALLGLPPPFYAVHRMLNLLFQFWIHTEVVPSIGFLELIINTPSSHRVHHGRNPYCIDKNYAGVLIIWDIMFGTYESEHDDDQVLYGVTHNINTFDPITIQMHQHIAIWKAVWHSKSVSEAFCRVFMGPGWTPEQPDLRLGNPADIPEVPNLFKNPKAEIGYYNPEMFGMATGNKNTQGTVLLTAHVIINFIFLILLQMFVQFQLSTLSTMVVVLATAFCVFTLCTIGMVFDGNKKVKIYESFRLGLVWPLVMHYLTQTGAAASVFGSYEQAAVNILMVGAPVGGLVLFWAAVLVAETVEVERHVKEKEE